MWRDYHLPTSVVEAVQLLQHYAGAARVVAGGTDLFIEMGEGRRPPAAALIDITRIPGLDQITRQDNWIIIGAAATHTQVVASPLIQHSALCLAESCGVVGGPQVRNVGTLCGNVAHGLPAADGTVSLMALDGEALIVTTDAPHPPAPAPTWGEGEPVLSRPPLPLGEGWGEGLNSRWLPLDQFFLGPGQVALDSTREVLAAIRLRPTGSRQGSAFHRIMRPQGIALPILGMAAVVTLDATRHRYEGVSLAVGPVAPVPFRARQTEAFLTGAEVSDATLQAAAELLVQESRPRTSAHRATREYRTALLPALARRVMTDAVDRARHNS